MTFELPLLVFLVMTAASAILVKDLISSVFILGTYSFTLALIWALLGAVDVAFVEAVVGAGLATVFFLLTLFSTLEKDTQIRRLPMPWTALVSLPISRCCFSTVRLTFPRSAIPAHQQAPTSRPPISRTASSKRELQM